MQVFLPFSSFSKCARVLDRQRLGKQRVECKQILMALRGETKAWANHPVVKAWRGHEDALARYGLVICEEWLSRGYKDSLLTYFLYLPDTKATWSVPTFTSNPEVNRMYRRILTHKNPKWYGRFWDEEPLEKCDYSLLK